MKQSDEYPTARENKRLMDHYRFIVNGTRRGKALISLSGPMTASMLVAEIQKKFNVRVTIRSILRVLTDLIEEDLVHIPDTSPRRGYGQLYLPTETGMMLQKLIEENSYRGI